ncbi:chromosomal replication initiator protein DnaA [Candidatus Saccharibacteria bacterium]|nr:chromosomal replication initiator protein DnaA [Candidatus Saccharibacteria bacterium]
MNQGVWQAVLGELETTMSHAVFVTWFKPTEVVIDEDGSFAIAVANVFAKQQFELKFNAQVLSALRSNGIEVDSVNYIIKSQKAHKHAVTLTDNVFQEALNSHQKATKPAKQPRKNTGTNLNPRYTLDNFVVGSSNDLAYAAAHAVVKNPGTKYNPLFIYGGAGLGKTHLIQGVGNEIARLSPSLRIVYISSETFVSEFLDYIRFKKAGFSDKYRNIDVLIIDDVQFIAGKEKTQEEFFHTFNDLHQKNKQIIISSDKPPKNIPTLTERLRSRFEWGMTIDIQMPDLETRCAILQTKASQSGVDLNLETAEFLAKNINTNTRELEGALNQLLAFCEVRGILPDVETAEGLIGDTRRSRPHHVTSRQIVDKTARYFRLDLKEIVGAKRDKHIVVPRQIAMYLLRSELHMSFPRIANELGRKDHTTAIHSVDKIERSLKLDQFIREQVAEIKEKIYE